MTTCRIQPSSQRPSISHVSNALTSECVSNFDECHSVLCCFARLAHRLEARVIVNDNGEPLRLFYPVRSIRSTVDETSVDGDAIDDPQLVYWFQSLETSMKHALEKSIFDLFDRRIDEHVERCLGIVKDQRHPRRQLNDDLHSLQSIVVVEHLLFEHRLRQLTNRSSNACFRREQ